ncbi:MAG: CRISPR-associated endonuclease Cas2 [Corallococcus sp.]|nr:CRISPR-associated endonuclease Cas2 [Corallococcus sp.]
MRILVFFDLPTETSADKTAYRHFRTFLIKEGFTMMQESVYSKLALNGSTVALVKRRLQSNIPAKGLVQVLVITEKQFGGVMYLVGASRSQVVDSTEKYVLV